MNRSRIVLLSLLCIIVSIAAYGQEHGPQKLQNPIDENYLQKNLRDGYPRLVLNSSIERQLKNQLKSDPVVKNMYSAIRYSAEDIYDRPLLERKVKGRRLLGVSREMLRRMNMLGMVYRIEKDRKVLERINEEVLAVCSFSDWNPSHFLDVAEMSLAVSFALDWTAGDLPASTIKLAKEALIKKGIKPSWQENEGGPDWAYGHNNWNQVCHGGMVAAAITIAEDDPELAAKTISRALDGMVYALTQYAPDGVYPEGSTYWLYGTSFSVVTAAMFESAFGTDFGIADYPSFIESAVFRYLMNAPSGWYYNFADCGDRRNPNGDIVLAWFAAQTGNSAFFERERFLTPPGDMEKLFRLSGAGLVWLSQYKETEDAAIPSVWKGDGSNPLVVFKNDDGNPNGYYFGGKGGRATTSHGNMDAGSFIFELNGVRWCVDPGNQSYHTLEKEGFNLWGRCQDCERWTLLTKNNFGHSTITVNNALFINDGQATLEEFNAGQYPSATFDLTALYGDNLNSVMRTFTKDSDFSVVIEDQVEINDNTEHIIWQMMTTADVAFTSEGAILKKNGKTLKVLNLSHPDLEFSIVSLDPPPLALDRQIRNLKRLEFRVPAWIIENGKTTIKVRLTGD